MIHTDPTRWKLLMRTVGEASDLSSFGRGIALQTYMGFVSQPSTVLKSPAGFSMCHLESLMLEKTAKIM